MNNQYPFMRPLNKSDIQRLGRITASDMLDLFAMFALLVILVGYLWT